MKHIGFIGVVCEGGKGRTPWDESGSTPGRVDEVQEAVAQEPRYFPPEPDTL